MKNLTELLENGLAELEQLKTDQGALKWYIDVNKKSSLNTLKSEAEKILWKLNKKYSPLVEFGFNDALFGGFNIYFKFDRTMSDLPFAYSHRDLITFDVHIGLRFHFPKEGTSDAVSDLVYEIYSGEIMSELMNAVREYYDPTRKIQNEYNDSMTNYKIKRQEFIRSWVDTVSDWVENGDTIEYDQINHILGFGCMVKEFTFVKKPNRKTGRVMVKKKNDEEPIDLFGMNKYPGSVVDILHGHFYFITDINQ